jgi:molecular chaperone GrpE
MLPPAVKEPAEKAPSGEELSPKEGPQAQGGEAPSPSSGGEKPLLEQLKEEIESLKGELKEERARAEKYLTQLKYLQSDYENLKRRQAMEIEAAITFGNEKLVKNLLSVIDELEMAVRVGRQGEGKEKEKGEGKERKDPLLEGVEMTLKRLYETLSREGLAKIEAVGRPFDPQLHEAAEGVFTKDYPEGTIIEEIRGGFTFKGKVIRPSVVKVAMSPKPSSCEGKPEEVVPHG